MRSSPPACEDRRAPALPRVLAPRSRRSINNATENEEEEILLKVVEELRESAQLHVVLLVVLVEWAIAAAHRRESSVIWESVERMCNTTLF